MANENTGRKCAAPAELFRALVGGDANQWAPAIVENIKPIEPPHDAKDYHLNKDLADRCIERIRMLTSVAPESQ